MRLILGLALLCTACFAGVTEAADIRSGLDVGTYPKAYKVVDVTGPAAGNGALCYRCRYGSQPVVNIFARKMDANVVKLIKEIDTVVGKNRDNKMAAFVVLLTDTPEKHDDSLRNVAKSNELKYTPLTVYTDAYGPSSYRLSKEADITVMMWVDEEVRVNHALAIAELDAAKIQSIAGDTDKILN